MCKRFICGMGFTKNNDPIRIIHDKENDKDYYLFADLCKIMNEQQATIDELRLQKKDNGLSVYVVRDGKNPVAMFFNEQRASFYCQEHMANLTYQQEKWCRVE